MTSSNTFPVFIATCPVWVNGFWKIRVFMNDKLQAVYRRKTSYEKTIMDVQKEMEKVARRHNGKTISWKQSRNNMNLAYGAIRGTYYSDWKCRSSRR